MLYPALLRVYLGKFLLAHAYHVLIPVKEYGAGAGSSLIQGQYVFFIHGNSSGGYVYE